MSDATMLAGPSVVAVYKDHASAENAVRLLHKDGFALDAISIMGRNLQITEALQDRGEAVVAELPEQRRRLIVLHASLYRLVLVKQDTQRCVQARSKVVLRHLEGEQGIADDVLHRLPLLAGEPQQRSVIVRGEQHEAARSRDCFHPGLRCLVLDPALQFLRCFQPAFGQHIFNILADQVMHDFAIGQIPEQVAGAAILVRPLHHVGDLELDGNANGNQAYRRRFERLVGGFRFIMRLV